MPNSSIKVGLNLVWVVFFKNHSIDFDEILLVQISFWETNLVFSYTPIVHNHKSILFCYWHIGAIPTHAKRRASQLPWQRLTHWTVWNSQSFTVYFVVLTVHEPDELLTYTLGWKKATDIGSFFYLWCHFSTFVLVSEIKLLQSVSS